MKKTAMVLVIITIFSKMLGFTRDISLSYFYGVSNISDAYLISITIPLSIFAFIGTGISTGYIPMYSKIESDVGSSEGNKYTSNLINILLILCTLIVIIIMVFTSQAVNIFASGFEGEVLKLAVTFTRISIFSIFFSTIIYVFTGFLQLKESYIIPALIGFPMNFFLILFIIISSKVNIFLLPIGSIVGAASQLLLLIPFTRKNGYSYRTILNIKDKYIKDMAFISLPVILGVSVNQINVLIDRTIASRLVIGGISALNYANRLNLFVQGLFVMSIATVMYPMISKMAAEKNMVGLKKSVAEAVKSINLLVIPATIGAMVFSRPMINLLFGRGAFDYQAISMTSYALFYYSIGMVGFGLREVLARAFYSMQDTKTPMINATIGMVLNIALNIILSRYLGIGGLALATSIAAIFTTGLMFLSLRKKIGPFGMKQIFISSLKILFASLAMGLIAKISFNYLTTNIFSQNLSLIIAIGIGALTYFVIIYFMKIDDVDVIVNAVKKKLTRTKAVA